VQRDVIVSKGNYDFYDLTDFGWNI
jgi:hypothetical protein